MLIALNTIIPKPVYIPLPMPQAYIITDKITGTISAEIKAKGVITSPKYEIRIARIEYIYTRGIVFGRTMLEISGTGLTFHEAVKTAFKDMDIPIILDADIGHKPPQLTIINGAIATIISENGKGSVLFELKQYTKFPCVSKFPKETFPLTEDGESPPALANRLRKRTALH